MEIYWELFCTAHKELMCGGLPVDSLIWAIFSPFSNEKEWTFLCYLYFSCVRVLDCICSLKQRRFAEFNDLVCSMQFSLPAMNPVKSAYFLLWQHTIILTGKNSSTGDTTSPHSPGRPRTTQTLSPVSSLLTRKVEKDIAWPVGVGSFCI